MAGRVINNTGLCGVAGDKTKFRIFGTGYDCFVVFLHIEAAADTGNDTFVIHLLAFFKAA